jgi:hypothetical protein
VETDTTSSALVTQGPAKPVEETCTVESRKSASARTSADKKECCLLAAEKAIVSTILSPLFIIPEVKESTTPSLAVAKASIFTKPVEEGNDTMASSNNASLCKRKIKNISDEAASHIASHEAPVNL